MVADSSPGTPDRASERPAQRQRTAYAIPLLASAFVAATAAGASVTLTTDEPLFELLLHAMIGLGFLSSLIGLRLGWNVSFLGAIMMVWAFSAYAVRDATGSAFVGILYPLEVQGDNDMGLATFVAWFLVAFCFMQTQRENLVFVFVTGLATFGLMATRNLNPELLGAFLVFLLASVYCWGYDHFLRTAERTRRRLDWKRWARAHVSGAALVFSLATVGGLALGNALYYTTPRMHSGLGLHERIWNYAGAHVQGYFLFRRGFQIGSGPIRLSREAVMKVRADSAQLWRGRSYDHYNGRGWDRSDVSTCSVAREQDGSFDARALRPPGPPPSMAYGPDRRPQSEGRPYPHMGGPPMWQPLVAAENPTPPGTSDGFRLWRGEAFHGREFEHEFEVVRAQTAAVFAAPYPYRVRFHDAAGAIDPSRGRLSTDSYGSLQTSTVMQAGQRYTVWSKLPDFTPDDLRSAPNVKYSEKFRERYIDQVNIEVATELTGLVEQLTAQATTDFDRAAAIKSYLENTCLYTLNVPYTPRGRDPVVHFVKRSRRGACDLFASAMALMCRLAGIPARVATGFNIGQYDADEGAFIVRGTDAHAWSEVYFPRVGWVPFDLVAARTLESQNWLSLLQVGQWRLVLRGATRAFLWGVLVLSCAYFILSALVDPIQQLNGALRRWRVRRQPMQLLALDYERLLQVLSRRASVRSATGATPIEVLAAAASTRPAALTRELTRDLEGITRAFYALRYGSRRAPEQMARLRERIRSARQRLRRAKRPR